MTDTSLVQQEQRLKIEQFLRQRSRVAAESPYTIKPQPYTGDAPLTLFQQSTWVMAQIDPAVPYYNESVNIVLPDNTHVELLRLSWLALVERHEALRTGFAIHNDIPVQIVHPIDSILTDIHTHPTAANNHLLPEIDFTAQPVAMQLELSRQQATSLANTPFDLEVAPLYRGFIAHVTQGYRLYLVFHHSIFDGFSLNTIIVPELSTLYNGFITGNSQPLAPIAIHYRDYAHWEQHWQQSGIHQQDLAFWRNRLADAPASLDLPIAHTPVPGTPHTGEIIRGIISPALTQSLRNLAGQENTSLFTVLLASIQSILFRYSHTEDICIGTSSANRKVKELEQVVGALINTVVLRGDLSGNPSFVDVMRRNHAIVLDALEHDSVAFERVIRELRPDHEPGKNPFFQVFLSLEPPIPAFQSGWNTRIGDFHSGVAKYDLYLIFEETLQGLAYVFTYDTAIFQRSDIKDLIGHWLVLLTAVVQTPQQSVATLPILDTAEHERIVYQWNATAKQFPADWLMQDLLEEHARTQPDAIAAIFAETAMTYQQLNERSNQAAYYLRDLGVHTGVIVGVCMDRSIDMLIAMISIMKSGGTYLPLDPDFPRDRLAMIIEDAKAQYIITSEHLRALLPTEKILPVMFDDSMAAYPVNNLINRSTADDILYILYTSGSTGKPKGVQITHRNMTNFLLSMQQEPGMTAHDVMLAVTTISFDIAELEIWLPLISGARCVIISHEMAMNGAAIQQIIGQHGVTIIQATPVSWNIWLQSGWTGTQKVKILCGGEAMSEDLAAQLLPRAASLWNMYGPTETTVWSTLKHIVEPGDISVGKPIANTQCYILDAHMQPVPVQVIGDLYIGGDGVAHGYFNRSSLNDERFIPNPFTANGATHMYKTGDLARYRANGEIEFLGRSDFQVKVRGFRIELGEIESVLRKHAAIADAVVIIREDVPGDQRIVGYVITHNGRNIELEHIINHTEKFLPTYMVPNIIIALEAFPRTPNHKIDRKALPKPHIELHEMDAFSTETWTPTEQRLAAIWCEMLNIPQVHLHDSFFTLGGHSLLGAILMRRLETEFHTHVPLSTLFHHKTVASLALYIDRAEQRNKQQTSTPTVAIHIAGASDDSNSPIFFIHSDWIGGGLYSAQLASQVPGNRPFYILDIDQTKQLPNTMEELAAWHIITIRAIQPQGPYTISGFCIGGLVAFEIAKQLQSAGNEVASLIMIDTAAAPQTLRIAQKMFARNQPNVPTMEHFLKFMHIHSFAEHFLMRGSAFLRTLISNLSGEKTIQEEDPYYAYQSSIDTEHANASLAAEVSSTLQSMYSWLYSGYIPGQYDGAIDLIVADKERLIQLQTPEREWTSRTRNLRIHTTPGTHISCRTDYVGELGTTFSRCLTPAQVEPTRTAYSK